MTPKSHQLTWPTLPPQIETVQSVALLHAAHHGKATGAERAMDQMTLVVSRPGFLGMLMLGVAGWIGANLALNAAGQRMFDAPPFPWLENMLTLLALSIAVLIVTTQRRADQLASLRDQMTLELSVMTEQKVAKVIELIEELRRDSPQVHDRVDLEASEMATRANTNAVLGAIEETGKEMRDGSRPAAPG